MPAGGGRTHASLCGGALPWLCFPRELRGCERDKSITLPFFLLNCNRHATLLSGPANDTTIDTPTYLQMPLPGIIQPVLCKAIDNCSEFDQETLSNARAKFQSTWPKCFRVEDLWLHAHRSARPVEKSLTMPHAQE